MLVSSISSATAQEAYTPLIGEVVVVAEVIALRQTGTLKVSFDGEEKELRLDSIRLPRKDSSIREKADELLLKRLLGKTVEVHVLGSQYGGEKNWIGYALQDGVDVRLELVAKGLARYCQGIRRQPEFELRDRQARKTEKGIWAKDKKDAVPPCEDAT
jgi:endonuclease YncB( thermonuclease family)